MYLWLWCHCLPLTGDSRGQLGTAWASTLTIAPSSLTQDSMGQHGPCPNPRPTPGSWCPTPDTSRHHHSHTRVTRTHCWMQYDYDNLHVQNICFEWYQYHILKASLSFLVLVFLPSPVLPSPQWRHQSQSEAATRPGCPSVCWPAAPRARGTIIRRFRRLTNFISDFKISPPSPDDRVPADHFLPFISHHKKMILFILSSLLVKWNWLAEDNTLLTATGFSHPFLLLVALVIPILLDIYLDVIYSTSALLFAHFDLIVVSI